MSRWLQNAANFLEKLDDTAGKVIVNNDAEHGTFRDDDDEMISLNSILAARGLDADDQDVDHSQDQQLQSEDLNAWNEQDDLLDLSMRSGVEAMTTHLAETEEPTSAKVVAPETNPADAMMQEAADVDAEVTEVTPAKADSAVPPETPFQTPRQRSTDPSPTNGGAVDELGGKDEPDQHYMPVPEMIVKDLATASDSSKGASAEAAAPIVEPPRPQALEFSAQHQQQFTQAQKEIRTLKRHVLALNQQLEASEHEIEAQRQELDSVGVLMEKERAKVKADKEKLVEQHQSEVKALKQKNDAETKQLQAQIRTMNQQRAHEGGNWTKEIQDALEREQETLRKVALLQDEKETLQQHINTLEHQQQALGSRLESLTETADAAMDRERQAETRLDELLTAHARQIQQRQLREAELEKTVSELGAALVKASDKSNSDHGATTLQTSSPDIMMIESLRVEMDTIQTQLVQEQQRNRILQEELRSASSERSDEATVLQLRKEQHDRQVQQLNDTILQLKKDLRHEKEKAGSHRMRVGDEGANQVRDLSEEVIRLREKLSGSTSEIAALKSRLNVALDRANRTEQALEERMTSRTDYHDIELGNGSARKRGAGVKGHPTMRAALSLNVVQGERTERLAKSLDSLDAFLAQSGRFLRHNAMARLFFMLYFVTMHMWTFVLLFVHVHGYETMHTDFTSGGHGPSGIIAQHVAQIALPKPGN